MLKKIISLLLAVLMIVALVGCGKSGRQIIKLTLSTEDSAAILAAAGIRLPAPEEAAGAGTTVKWFSHDDWFHNYDEGEVVNTGFFTFTEMYGCELEWVQTVWGQRFDDLANQILGGTPPDFTSAETSLFPMKVMKGIIQPVEDYIDYDSPLFAEMKPYVDTYFTLNGHQYYMLTDMGFGCVFPYNRRVINDFGYDDPADLFYNDQWTWDEFSEMCLDFTDPDADRYALDGWYFSRAIMQSTGVSVVGYNADTGRFFSNLDDPRLERAADALYELQKNETCYPWWNGWVTRNGGVEGGGVKDGLCLFWPVGSWGFTGPVETIAANWGDVTQNELMFVPSPRDPNGDGNYYLDCEPNGYVLINQAENPEGVALLAMCDRFKIVDPTVVNIDEYQLKNTYKWTDEMLDMYHTCYEMANSGVGNILLTYGVDADAGYGSDIGGMLRNFNDDIGHPTSAGGAATWAQAKASYQDTLEYNIDELNKRLDEFEASGGVAEPSAGNS